MTASKGKGTLCALLLGAIIGISGCGERITTPLDAPDSSGEAPMRSVFSSQVIGYDASGMRAGVIMRTPVAITAAKMRVTGATDVIVQPGTKARILGENASLDLGPSPIWEDRARVHRYHSGGHEIIDAYVPDDDRASGRPPKRIYHSVDGRVVSLFETKYKMASGSWVPVSGRMILFDETGKRSGEVRYQLDEKDKGVREGAIPLHSPRTIGALRTLSPPSPVFDEGGGGIGEEDGGEARCSDICTVAATTLAHATATGVLAVKALKDCVNLEDPSACPEAYDLGVLAAEQLKAAYNLASLCAACLLLPPPPANIGDIGGSGGGSGELGCTDWYLIRYYPESGTIISIQYLGCYY